MPKILLFCFVCNIFFWKSLPIVCRFHAGLQLSAPVHRGKEVTHRKEELPCLENRTRPWLAVLLKSSLLQDPSTGADAFFSTDSVKHVPSPPGFPTGLVGFKQSFTFLRQAFPDLHSTVEDTIAEGD